MKATSKNKSSGNESGGTDIESNRFEIDLAVRSIDDLEFPLRPSEVPIDAIAVGHYLGVRPASAELALDRAISGHLRCSDGRFSELAIGRDGDIPDDEDCILAQFTDRGTLRGDLGQLFLLTDPRESDRTLVVAGMGMPGRFGTPELVILVREVCWTLGMLNKKHLATVLIGTGSGNLSGKRSSIAAWLRGIAAAITAPGCGENRLAKITFFTLPKREDDLNHGREWHEAIEEEVEFFNSRTKPADYPTIVYRRAKDLAELEEHGEQPGPYPLDSSPGDYYADGQSVRQNYQSRNATRITICGERNTVRFGKRRVTFDSLHCSAMVEGASVPERTVSVDADLLKEANFQLASSADPALQREFGEFLQHLVFPIELRDRLISQEPLIMVVDTETAQIHWEMMVSPDSAPLIDPNDTGSDKGFDDAAFLGTSRGLTRQFLTSLAPLPSPRAPRTRDRNLYALVVIDPTDLAAETEGEDVAWSVKEGKAICDLFHKSGIEYSLLCSPNRMNEFEDLHPRRLEVATRSNVLRHLAVRDYDLLHFSGHCVFDRHAPEASGWLFPGDERLTAYEMDRIDRVPSFVFSNACESLVTMKEKEEKWRAEQAELAQIAPGFAESFFARGVSNFVGTAWEVGTEAACKFAVELYSSLCGKPENKLDPQPMYEAMHRARKAVAQMGTSDQFRSWGAYRHYGDPYYQLIYAR